MTSPDRVAGSLFGLAYGDAMGAPTEFITTAKIAEKYGPAGPRDLVGTPAEVTDDTQMALAVAGAVLGVTRFAADELEPRLRHRFVTWSKSPDNNRGPGATCMRAILALSKGHPWQRATITGSKGCGANMRVTPIGLLPGLDADAMAGAAQLQAALTHGHPTALAASDLTAYATRLLVDGHPLEALPSALLDRCAEQRWGYRADWLGELWEVAGASSATAYIEQGWAECAAALTVLRDALRRPDDGGDACLATGEGWIAEEALATGLYCALRHPDDPVSAISRGAFTSGDSDSVAALAGAFVGAANGMAAWPADWARRIEYGDHLAALSRAWGRV